MDPLIPGLPDDLARECLIRVSATAFPALDSTSETWRRQVRSPAFRSLRKSAALARPVIAVAQCSSTSSVDKTAPTRYDLNLYHPDRDSWSGLSPAPGRQTRGLPLFWHLAAAGTNLVVLGGFDPASWAASPDVDVYDFVSGEWRQGRPMPGPARSFFACASDSERTVFVAGGHDDDKNALRSALSYDVEADQWEELPPMGSERDEPKGVFRRGRFEVIGGYSTEAQGQFGESAEVYDPATGGWSAVEGVMEKGECPRTCVAGGDGSLYRLRGDWVEVRGEEEEEGRDWRKVAQVPEEVRVAASVVAVRGEEGVTDLMVMGSGGGNGEGHSGYLIGADRKTWRLIKVMEGLCKGNVQAGCSLEI